MKFPLARLPGEEFRLIKDYDMYCISNYGRIYSAWKRLGGISNGMCVIGSNWRQLKTDLIQLKYLRVSLCDSRSIKTAKLIHVLVLETFVGPKPKGYIGCHNDGNSLNNHVSNLRWDSYQGNEADKIIHGTQANNKGVANPASILSEEDVLGIRRQSTISASQLSVNYGVSRATISDICRRKTWRHI